MHGWHGRRKTTSAFLTLALVCGALSMLQSQVAIAATAGSDWSTAIPGYSAWVTATPTGRVIASSCLDEPAKVSPLRVLDSTGAESWRLPDNTEPILECRQGSVGDSAGNIYTVVDSTNIGAVRSYSSTGALRWTSPTGSLQSSIRGVAPVTDNKGAVYFSLWDGRASKIRGYDSLTGTLKFERTYSDVIGMSANATGVAVATGVQDVEYLDAEGNMLKTLNTGDTRAYEAFSTAGSFDGSMFVVGYTACPGPMSVTKFTPSGRSWTWSDKTANACGQTFAVATPNGGVFVSRGAASSEADLASLSADGTVLWQKHSNEYVSQGVVDTNGVLVIPSSYSFDCNSIYACYGAHINFFRQDSAAAERPALDIRAPVNAYAVASLAITAGKLYVSRYRAIEAPAEVSGFAVPGIASDYRLKEPSATSVKVKYVALGDSFSAGEGVAPYWEPENACHRSKSAYAHFVDFPGSSGTRIFAQRNSQNIGWGFQACSGATTSDLLSTGQHGDPLPQLALERSTDTGNVNSLPVDGNTNLVTLTIGGNDVQFSKILEFCFSSSDCTTEKYQGLSLENYVAGRLKALGPKLDQVYAQINLQAPNARILVLGYPQLFPGSPAEQNCAKLAQRKLGRQSVGFSQKEQNFLRGQESRVNQMIADHVSRATSATFVAVDGIFAGHEICGGSGEWINGPTATKGNRWPYIKATTQSFHPNESGHKDGYAKAINLILNGA